MRNLPSSLVVRLALAVAIALASASLNATGPGRQGQALNTYTVIGLDGRRLLPYRVNGNSDLISLDQVARLFNLSVSEDKAANVVTVSAGSQRIVLSHGQAMASISGRVVALSGPVIHDGNTWFVPVDILSRVIGPATNARIDVRRASHLIGVGSATIAQVTPRIERQSSGIRVTFDTDSPVGHRVTRDGPRVVVHFDSSAIELEPAVGSAPDFVATLRADGANVVLEPGTAVGRVNVTDDGLHLAVDLVAAASPLPGLPAPVLPPLRLPPAHGLPDQQGPGTIRTVVLDPGHGGDDAGVKGPGGTLEKDLVLQLARRIKSALETRVGIRVLLTREADETIPPDRRSTFANTNSADMFLALHANGSLRPTARGVQVLSIRADDYRAHGMRSLGTASQVSVMGGTRVIEAVPWDLAQVPFAEESASLGATLLRHLSAHNVPMFARPSDLLPLRVLAGINMPAVLLEVGFLTNTDDEQALNGNDLPASIVDAIVESVVELRRAPAPRPVPPSRRP